MNATHVGIVLCRIASAVLAVQAISMIGMWFPGLLGQDIPGEFVRLLVMLACMTIVPVVAAIGLWVFAERICTVPASVHDGDEPSGTGDIIAVATALLGLWVIIGGLTYAAMTETQIFSRDTPEGLDEWSLRLSRQAMGYRIRYLLEIGFGLWLIFGRERIVAFLMRTRRAGVDTGD